jgi:hypothetical protein
VRFILNQSALPACARKPVPGGNPQFVAERWLTIITSVMKCVNTSIYITPALPQLNSLHVGYPLQKFHITFHIWKFHIWNCYMELKQISYMKYFIYEIFHIGPMKFSYMKFSYMKLFQFHIKISYMKYFIYEIVSIPHKDFIYQIFHIWNSTLRFHVWNFHMFQMFKY